MGYGERENCGEFSMASWVTHLIIADRVLEKIPILCRHEFCVGNIAPDCNVENEDWTSFTPSREVTHWMTAGRKVAADCDRFLHEYIEKKEIYSIEEESFLLGYYAHLITDAEFQRVIRDEDRVKASWERMGDIYSIEREYLDEHPNSGYLTEIIGLESFPDYLDYLPMNAIPRKIKVMGYMPQKTVTTYPYVGMSKEEYYAFLDSAIELWMRYAYIRTEIQITSSLVSLCIWDYGSEL